MRIGIGIVGFVGFFWAATAGAGQKMTMADLKALAESGSHDELLDHAKDIAPGKRDATWKALVEKAAIEELDGIDVGTQPWVATTEPDDLARQFPHLKASRAYMDKRAEVGVKGFAACYKRSWSGVNCTERLVAFVKADKGNAKLAVDAGNVMIREQFPYVAVRVYRFAILDRKGPVTSCGEAELQRSVQAAIENLLDDDAIKKDALKMKDVCAAAKK